MKPLSESLEDLAGRVKVLEDSATATFEADRAKLEKRRHEIDEAFKSDVRTSSSPPSMRPQQPAAPGGTKPRRR